MLVMRKAISNLVICGASSGSKLGQNSLIPIHRNHSILMEKCTTSTYARYATDWLKIQ